MQGRDPPTLLAPGRLLIVAVDADTGERRVFDRTNGVSLIDAAMASCAVAGIRPAVTIDGRRYIDGGFYSTDGCSGHSCAARREATLARRSASTSADAASASEPTR